MCGYNKTEFSVQEQIDSSGNATGNYYYEHPETACYYCIVNNSGSDIDTLDPSDANYSKKITAYYNALAREKYNLSKISKYVNGSDSLFINTYDITEPGNETEPEEHSEPIQTYSITFNNLSGTGGTSYLSDIAYGETLSSIIVPTKTGNRFNGYYELPNGSGQKWYNNNGTPSKPTFDRTENITLYAYWTEMTDVGGGGAEIDDPIRPPLVTE